MQRIVDSAECGADSRHDGALEPSTHDHPASERRLKAASRHSAMGFQLRGCQRYRRARSGGRMRPQSSAYLPSPDARASKASRNAGRVEGRLSTLSPDAMSPTGPHSQGEATMHGSPIRSILVYTCRA
ncbi:hypothetical protein TNCV_1353301 [Trichonephila clavipes]|nr:hypothetical protein TNCV_1353301 [Trichonephila clavipes]